MNGRLVYPLHDIGLKVFNNLFQVNEWNKILERASLT